MRGVPVKRPRADDFLAHDWEKAKMSVEERIRRKSGNRWISREDVKTILVILATVLVFWAWAEYEKRSDSPALHDEYLEDPR